MEHCEVCKREFPPGTAECPDDKVPLVDELPYQTIEAVNTAWVEIASATTEDEARILQGFLEAEGIPCQVESLKFTMEPVNLGMMGEIRLYVPAEHEERAIELLEQRDDDFESLPDDGTVMTDEGPALVDDPDGREESGDR
jgi:hypothetical protein